MDITDHLTCICPPHLISSLYSPAVPVSIMGTTTELTPDNAKVNHFNYDPYYFHAIHFREGLGT